MDWRAGIRERLAPLNLAPEREHEIVEEVAQHLEDRYREMRASGRDDESAVAAAWRELEEEGVMARELARNERSHSAELPAPVASARGSWLRALAQDLRVAIRTCRRQPIFAATVTLALALAIGPSTAIVSVVNWMFWRPLPGVAEPDRLALVWFGRWNPSGSLTVSRVSYPNLADVEANLKSAVGLAGFSERSATLVVGRGIPRAITMAQVTHDFFTVLGVSMSSGRTFQLVEDRGPFGAPVAIVSRRFAETAFGTPAAAMEQTLLLNRRPFRVIGVVASEFQGVHTASDVDVWITGASSAYLSAAQTPAPTESRTYRSPFYQFVARVAPGATPADLQREFDVAVRALADAYPADNTQYRETSATVFSKLNMEPFARERMWAMTRLLLLLGAVLLVLGCANAANMLIAHAIRRGHEMVVRHALGAGTARLTQMQLVESCLLALAGALVGLALAMLLKQTMQQWLFPSSTSPAHPIPMDWRVLVTTGGAGLVVGLGAGLAPAWLATRWRPSAGVVQVAGSRTVSKTPRLRSGLAVVQLALSLTLVIGALLLAGTLGHLRRLELGFDPDRLTIHRLDLAPHGYSGERALAYYRNLLHSLRTGQGTEAAVAYSPFDSSFVMGVSAVESADAPLVEVRANGIGDRFFTTERTAMVAGRELTSDEAFTAGTVPGAPVVINETLARRLFGTASAIGRPVYMPRRGSSPAVIVVGVVRDVRADLLEDPMPSIYFPLGRFSLGATSVALITRSANLAAIAGRDVAAAAGRIDSLVPVGEPRAASDTIDQSIHQQRLFAGMLSWLSGIAFLLAAVGLHGLVAQTTMERAREFGIRIALGATRVTIARLVASYVLTITATGTAIGLLMAWLGSPLVQSLLFGVTALEPTVYALAVALLAAIVAVAAAWPAFRATRVQPVEVLRAE